MLQIYKIFYLMHHLFIILFYVCFIFTICNVFSVFHFFMLLYSGVL